MPTTVEDAFNEPVKAENARLQKEVEELKVKLKAKAEAEPIEVYLRRENTRLHGKLESLKEITGFREEITDQILEVVHALEPLPLEPWKKPAKGAVEMSAVLQLSDWHIGEVIDPTETENFGTYNWSIAKYRAEYIAEKFIEWVHMHQTAFHVPRIYILGLADWVSGDIHGELRATNEFPLPEQAIRSGELLAHVVAMIAPHAPEVYFVQVEPDNHGRLQPKPQFKQKARNSMSFVTYAQANALLREHKNIQVINNHRMKEMVSVNGVKILCEHGDNIKAWMGIPYYGMERMRGKEASKRMVAMLDQARQLEMAKEFSAYKQEFGFDYLATGHFHVAGVVSWNILMGGSLSGTTEFDAGCGRHAPPHQPSFMMHPKHKLFDWTPWIPER